MTEDNSTAKGLDWNALPPDLRAEFVMADEQLKRDIEALAIAVERTIENWRKAEMNASERIHRNPELRRIIVEMMEAQREVLGPVLDAEGVRTKPIPEGHSGWKMKPGRPPMKKDPTDSHE